MEHIRDWSGLIHEMLVEITKHISVVEDFMAFRGVCASWRSAAKEHKFANALKGVPLLMLAEKEDSDEREFYCLSGRKTAMRIPLPEAKGRRCMEAGFGWFLTVSSSGEINLLNPFSRSQIQLPGCTTFPDSEENHYHEYVRTVSFISRAALSANPTHTSDIVVAVIYSAGSHSRAFALAFWRTGDLMWTGIEPTCTNSKYWWDVGFYSGKFFAINARGQVFGWDHGSSSSIVTRNKSSSSHERVATANLDLTLDFDILLYRAAYLLESSSGELLVVTRDGVTVEDDDWSYGVTNFKVVRLDLIKCVWEEITTLGLDAIFVGHSLGISVVASAFPDAIKPNCIYFSDDCVEAYSYSQERGKGGGRLVLGGGEDMGIYNFEDGSIDRFSDIESLSFICPPVWISF
ncbi:OLC1v1029622C1 [Oldenlandia corymbosa var. corymbosa]|uniref:OLC1v1029622C1 n=1 Tax=Oldenlandia corymbosa var. corymbosa TaxID=529605 RepID=A0AAV1CE84_OLDCO|nr:OLC1v1029622C1 [Oldenlandia corymbosa var. corymbosa]